NLMARRRFAGVRPAVDRLDPHALHQRRDMTAANRNAFAPQQIAQHPAAREGIIEMQLVDAPHDLQVLRRDRPRLVIDGAPADVQRLRLPRKGEIVALVDHRFALNKPALVSAPSKKSFSSASSPIFASSTFKSTFGALASLLSWPKTPAAPSRS